MTEVYTLKAMANNYRNGHSWDHLDGEVCLRAVDEIKTLQQRLDEATAIIREQGWQWKPYDDYYHRDSGYYCPECGVSKGSPHSSGCEIGNFLSIADKEKKQ